MLLGIKDRKTLFRRHGIMVLFSLALVGLFWLSRGQWVPEMRLWRAVGDAGFVLLAMALSIGPLARLWLPARRWVAWRRELGIWFALLALGHGVLILSGWVGWSWRRFLGYEFVPQLGRWARLEPGFGLANLLGLAGLIWALVLMATSSDWAVRKLGIASWKWLQTGAYIIFYLVALHAVYFLFIHYTVSFHRPVPDPNWFRYPMAAIGLAVIGLQGAAYAQVVRRRQAAETSSVEVQKAILIGRRQIARGTYEMTFSVKSPLHFLAGQHTQVRVLKLLYPDPQGASRVFSIASSPTDKTRFSIAWRDTGSGYKRTLLELPIKTEVLVDRPGGQFILPDDIGRPVLMVAGGIGITPIMSMVRWAAEKKLPQVMVLLYANSSRERAAYLEELQELAGTNKHFSLRNQYQPIDGKVLAGLSKPYKNPIWYVVGPPGMVDSVRLLLSEAGAGEPDIIIENFDGYDG